MKAIVTGMNGTVAPAIAEYLAAQGHAVVPWDRSRTPIDDPRSIQGFIDAQQPDWFLHVATGSPDWAEQVARVSAERGIRFLFTSSVSVFGPEQRGPLTVDVAPAASDDYGAYKLDCERRVARAHPAALIARLGWQIGTRPGSNTMLEFAERTMREQGRIEASTRWYPACAFLMDTAASVVQLLESYPAGVYHLDGNPGLSFFEIMTALNRLHGGGWNVIATDAPEQNNRMLDERIEVRPITARLR